MAQTRSRTLSLIVSFALCCGLTTSCTPEISGSAVPSASELGNPRGYSVIRAITHFHSPYSWDACDKNGMPGGVVDSACYQDLVDAMCKNRVNYLFLTDHPDSMAQYEMSQLLLAKDGDQLILNQSGDPYAKIVGGCANGFKPTFLVGYEDKIMAMGMTKHLESTAQARLTAYGDDSNAIRLRLANETGAIVAVPHTESRSLASIQSLNPHAVEITNFHAAVDPKIRKTHLGVPPFSQIATFISYLIDPYGQLLPDYGLLALIQTFPVYFNLWNSLIASGYHVTGISGTDSHQNVLPQKAADGERLDSHRRVARLMSSHWLVSSDSVSEVKNAIINGRGWIVFEILGTPVDMDFLARVGSTTIGVGDSISLNGASATIQVPLPTLHKDSPQGDKAPVIVIRLKQVLTGGEDQVVATSVNAPLSYVTSQTGAYRAELSIVPYHLKKYLGPFSNLSEDSYPWIITNHLYLNR